MASKSYDSIVSDIIDNMLIANPTIDVKIGSVIRDIFIDSEALELQNLYSVADNTSQAQSITTAVGQQLDRIAYNYGTSRNPVQRASVNLVVEVQNGIQAPTPLNIGDQFYTSADTNNDSQVFINTQFQLLQPGAIITQLPLVALNAGSAGNVPANTITNSSYDFASAVYNPEPSSGGADIESDIALAARLPIQVTGQWLNTTRGIYKSVQGIDDINGNPYIVTPDNILSRGPYTVDVYLQRDANYFGTTINEVAPANTQNYVFQQQPLYALNPINQITIYNPANQTTTTVPTTEYQVINNPADVQQNYIGTVKATQMLNWIGNVPTLPYTISYNYDHTVMDAQNVFNGYAEVVSDVLYKQAIALPIFISANLVLASGANVSNIYSNAYTNLISLFNNLQIAESLSSTELAYTFLQDSNVLDVKLTNFDTTYQITLNIPQSSGFITPTQVSEITQSSAFGYYYEADTASPVSMFNIASRLWIGNPNIINSGNQNSTTGFNFVSTSGTGVTSQNVIQGVTPSWSTNVYPFYDSVNQLLLLNFTSAPPAGATLTFNIVQDNLATSNNLSYLTLAASLTNAVYKLAPSIPTTNPQYATLPPLGINSSQAVLYQNGVPLNPGSYNYVGDYQIVSQDSSTGLLTIAFTTPPSSSDNLQFGVLNPKLSFSFASG